MHRTVRRFQIIGAILLAAALAPAIHADTFGIDFTEPRARIPGLHCSRVPPRPRRTVCASLDFLDCSGTWKRRCQPLRKCATACRGRGF